MEDRTKLMEKLEPFNTNWGCQQLLINGNLLTNKDTENESSLIRILLEQQEDEWSPPIVKHEFEDALQILKGIDVDDISVALLKNIGKATKDHV